MSWTFEGFCGAWAGGSKVKELLPPEGMVWQPVRAAAAVAQRTKKARFITITPSDFTAVGKSKRIAPATCGLPSGAGRERKNVAPSSGLS